MEENMWIIELESALLDDCNVNDIFSICQGKPLPEALRPDVWQVCLDVRHKSDQMSLFNEIYDLPFQSQLREDCKRYVERIGNDEEDKVSVVSDLESIMTFYCKNRNLQYEADNGWIELLLPLFALKLNRSDTFNLFESIRDTYIPKGCKPKGNVFHVFRLLLLYHDPELCTVLDTKKITPDLYSLTWFQSLFASCSSLSVIIAMWDLYFQNADPFMVFFLALIILINGREQIMALKTSSKEEIIKFLINMPCALEVDDVPDFCSLAQYYALKTPTSFKTDYLKALYGKQNDSPRSQEESNKVSQALCLPVSVYELVENSATEFPVQDAVRFFLVDCRPAEQYNAGHLSTAFHLDCNLMLQEPVAFATAVQGLLTAQKQAIEVNSNAGGEHLCFMGSGRVEEDQYTHMVVASFLQKNTHYVSLLTGGYTSIHDYFGDHMADCLEDHSVSKCLVCQQHNVKTKAVPLKLPATTPSSTDLFSKFSAAMKSKSAEVKGRLLDIIVNPSSNGANATAAANNGAGAPSLAAQERHVSAKDRNGKRYRNVAPVFSIDDENEDAYDAGEKDAPLAAGETKEIVNLNQYFKTADIINAFKCQDVHMNGYMYDSHLIITPTQLVVLRELGGGQAQIMVRRPLASIVKITAKKRHRNLITFKYGFPDGDGLLITDMDRFLIPNATEATALVSKHIVQVLDNAK
ncbi:TBC1 domain family member 23 [Drosophila sulfurigaster albostrigata]|uniref:TBC1 domain family member 23 n=1 Tax=Drosophila albomicans TaxID=7291 RepID=A0A6P8WJG8_DROAB|nr:TBC1 domain family member 23 [Drosophila albomicans]XP_060666769.1 TBC1 domain family member 23 [Drosophila nasuta]XP_062142392.1 TBC1 domain family member 23 [Drosophila sulfurigaster albostrigata]